LEARIQVAKFESSFQSRQWIRRAFHLTRAAFATLSGPPTIDTSSDLFAECGGGHLETIPRGIVPGTQVFQLIRQAGGTPAGVRVPAMTHAKRGTVT
jgi:hypothetical protein